MSSSVDRSLQLSLLSFKDRVMSQQNRIEELERENRDLRRSRMEAEDRHESDAVLVRQLEEANLHLRQRNLELTQALLNKNMSLSSIGSFNEGFSGVSGGGGCSSSGAGESLAPPADEVCRGGGGGLDADDESSLDALERGETNDPTAEVLTRLEQQNISKIMEVKKTLLEQQKTLMGVIHARSRELEAAARQKGFTSMSQDTSKACELHEGHQMTTQASTDQLPGERTNGLTRTNQEFSSDRQCPMCEVAFPEGQVSLEDFESHVLEHFSYEDSQSMETIRNFDLMLDAPNSYDGDFG